MSAGDAVRTAVLAVLVFATLLVIGVDLGHCLLLALTAAVLHRLRGTPVTEDDGWPEHEDNRTDAGARREVDRLSWGLRGFESRVDRRSLAHLRGIATRRLRWQGVDLDDPADADRARALLGADAYAALTADPGTPPRYDAYARAAQAVEQLTERTTP
ncbi:hypothetical protein GCM10009616_01010 [Microlunatus lacustris]